MTPTLDQRGVEAGLLRDDQIETMLGLIEAGAGVNLHNVGLALRELRAVRAAATSSDIIKRLTRQENLDISNVSAVRDYLDRDSVLHHEAADALSALLPKEESHEPNKE